jgi:hypothetical protein
MPNHPTGRPARRPATLLAAVALVAAVVLGACSASAPSTSFDPASPCPAQGQQPGAFPDLEAMLPTEYDGAAPTTVDSGRSCTAAMLGTLAEAGVAELRFAGATWATGGTSGITVAVFEADRLDATVMRDFYQRGAEQARRTEKVQASDVPVGGKAGKRLDVLGSDGTGQTVVAWPADRPGRVWVLLAADLGDTKVAAALEAFGSR